MKKTLTKSEHYAVTALLHMAKSHTLKAIEHEKAIKEVLGINPDDGIGDIDHLSDFIWNGDPMEELEASMRRAGITLKEQDNV